MAKKAKKGQASPLAMWPLLAAVLVIAGMVLALVAHLRSENAAPQPAASGFWGDHYASQGHQGHMSGDDKRFAHFHYSTDPPTSGYHREIFSPALINSSPLPKYVQVHLLEHGNILLQYNCLCPDTVQQLGAIADEYNAKVLPPGTTPSSQAIQTAEESGQAVIVAPYPQMTHTIALTAWTRVATLGAVNKTKIESFVNQWLHNSDNINQ